MLVGAGCASLAVAVAAFIWAGPLSAVGAGACVGAAGLAVVSFSVRPSTARTAALTITAAAASIVLTAFYSSAAGPAEGVAALAEAAALLVLLIMSTRLPSARLAVACCMIAGLAISVLVLRLTEIAAPLEGLGMSLFGAMLACSAAAIGVDGRRRDHKRRHHAIQIRRSQRIELSKDLHDFLGHDLSAILVQAQAAIAVADHDPAQQWIALRGIEAGSERSHEGVVRALQVLGGSGYL